jgi:hypothetical protein
MSVRTYKDITETAKKCINNVNTKHELGIYPQWAYYFAKSIITPKTDIKRIKTLQEAPKPTGNYISRQIPKAKYLEMAKYLIWFCEKKGRLPNYIEYKTNKRLSQKVYCLMFADIVNYYNKKGKLPTEINVNSKRFVKPTEPENVVYAYFKKVFGEFGDTIDGALSKIDGNGYAGYYDDVYSNKTSIDRMRDGDGINCTDSCHVFYNIMLELIKKGRYKKVECLHVGCSSGTGHVRLRITLNDNDTILRDPASVLNGNGVTSNWCVSNFELWAIDPDWFMENLHK